MISKIINEKETNSILVVRDGNELQACIHLKKLPDADSVYIGMITVSPTLQNRRIGSKMLVEAEKYAQYRWKDVSKAKMTVITQRHSLIEFYKRRDYRDTGIVEPFPTHDQRFGIPKVQNLQFCVLEKQL
jgi:ribosomal protein S18 acetylase RimI-like enzyme